MREIGRPSVNELGRENIGVGGKSCMNIDIQGQWMMHIVMGWQV